MGQKIGEAKAFVSTPVHSSVSGKVKKIEKITTPDGRSCQAVVIENNGLDELGYEELSRSLDSLIFEEICVIVKESGITGQGGASFPTHVKLSVPAENPIDAVILNGAECEPYLTCDQLLMENQPERVLDGLAIIMKAVGAKEGCRATRVMPTTRASYSERAREEPSIKSYFENKDTDEYISFGIFREVAINHTIKTIHGRFLQVHGRENIASIQQSYTQLPCRPSR